jgi:hypothetical protein
MENPGICGTAHRARHCAASGDASRATARSEQAAPLTARFARHSFLRGLRRRFARLRLHSCTTARLSLAAPLTVGSVRSRRTSPRFWAVTAFSRYAERVGFALSVTRRYECALSSSAIAAHRFGKPLTMQVSRNPHFKPRRGQPVGALAASFLSLAAGTQSRTDDKAIRPALHEAGS